MRILDADALLKMINSKKGMIGCTGLRNYINFMAKDDKDIVEVVRCKDCKYFDGECCDRYADETLGYSHSTQPNFFCACGERKNDV